MRNRLAANICATVWFRKLFSRNVEKIAGDYADCEGLYEKVTGRSFPASHIPEMVEGLGDSI